MMIMIGTLALQIADMISQQLPEQGRTLYVSGEESIEQVAMRANRMKTGGADAFKRVDIINQPNLSKVIASITKSSPYKAVVVDSIQTVFLDDVDSDAGGVVQIRACALACVHLAKASRVPVILIG
jgi:DNA repair protein RadA/Sms